MESTNKHEAKIKNNKIKPVVIVAEIVALLIAACVLVMMSQTNAAGKSVLKSTVAVVHADAINIQTLRTHKTLNTSLSALDKRAADEQAKSIERAKKEAEEKAAKEKAEQQAASTSNAQASASRPAGRTSGSGNAAGVVDFAYSYLGSPYVAGGSSPSGFCCSGFVWYVFTNAGGKNWSSISVGGLYSEIGGTAVAVSDMQPGDIVFFGNLSHVGIYVGNGQIIDAGDESTGVRIANLNIGWMCNYNNIYEVRRVL